MELSLRAKRGNLTGLLRHFVPRNDNLSMALTIVITGMEVVAPNGIGVENLWDLPSYQPLCNIEVRIQLKKLS
jgi:hypothetical protein